MISRIDEPGIFFEKNSYVNTFLSNVPFSHPLKPSENLWFSDVFRGYKMGTLGKKWVQ